MATSITTLLNDISTAKYGREVRQSIHDAIELCYNEAGGEYSQLTALAIQYAISDSSSTEPTVWTSASSTYRHPQPTFEKPYLWIRARATIKTTSATAISTDYIESAGIVVDGNVIKVKGTEATDTVNLKTGSIYTNMSGVTSLTITENSLIYYKESSYIMFKTGTNPTVTLPDNWKFPVDFSGFQSDKYYLIVVHNPTNVKGDVKLLTITEYDV